MTPEEIGPRTIAALTAGLHTTDDGLAECKAFIAEVGPSSAATALFALIVSLLRNTPSAEELLADIGLAMARQA